jgi:bile acid-coenzyme A ligase
MALVSYGRRVTELAARDGQAVALVHDGTSLSRGELETRANRLAHDFAARGVEPGDTVTFALPNGIEHCVVCLATWKLGAVPNPISPGLPEGERQAIVACADPALVFGFESTGRPSLPAGHQPDRRLPDSPLPDRTPPHERALASGGSTGTPKLIVPSNPAAYDPDNPSPIFRSRHASLVPGPLSHAVPFSACWQAVFAGAQAVLMSRFDASQALALIEEHRVDRVCFVPTMMLRIWRLPAAKREARDLTSLEFVMSGGAPLPAWLMRAWIDWLGPDVMHEAFGPSERIGGTFITGHEWLAHPGSVGRPSVGSRLRILDPETREDLPAGQLGEIFWLPAGGTGSTYRYVGAEAVRTADGWESVGDMGWIDADGYLFLGDRRSDMILTGGRNVYPAELPHEDLGDAVHALVELSEPVSDDALLAHLRDRVARYKLPRTFERCDHPLRDDAGKVRRAALRAERSRGDR